MEWEFTLEEYRFRARTEADLLTPPPWKHQGGHGPVSDWRPVVSRRPGESVLVRHDSTRRARFYDRVEALAIAERDRWGLSDWKLEELRAQLCREPTDREIAEEAVREDFLRLRRYAQGFWGWVGVVVELLDTDGEPTGEEDDIWGIESDSEPSYFREVADEAADNILCRLGRPTHLVLPLRSEPEVEIRLFAPGGRSGELFLTEYRHGFGHFPIRSLGRLDPSDPAALAALAEERRRRETLNGIAEE